MDAKTDITQPSASNAKAGRPQKEYSESIVHKLEVAIGYGVGVRIACEHAGISKSQYYDWLREKPEFMDRMQAARNLAILIAGQNVARAIIEDHDPRISFQFLKAKLPEEFNEKQVQVNIQTNLQNNTEVVSVMTPLQRDSWNEKFKRFLTSENSKE